MLKTLNVGLVAHVDAGKTTLTEQLLYTAGALRGLGRVDDGTTQSDFLTIERERGISVRASSTHLQWRSCELHLVDTPGHADFTGEVERSLGILDCAVLLVSAVEGIQSQTELLIDAFTDLRIPFLVFVNKLDRTGADYSAVCQSLRDRLKSSGITCVQCSSPQNEGGGDLQLSPSPDLTEELLSACGDDALLEAFLEGSPLPDGALEASVREAVLSGSLCLMLGGSAKLGIGIDALLDALDAYCAPIITDDDIRAPLCGRVYKLEHDPRMGKVCHVRLFSGSLRNRDSVYLPRVDAEEKITQIRSVSGRQSSDLGQVQAGGLAALYGLRSVRAGDLLGQGIPPRLPAALTVPVLTVQALPAKEEDRIPLLGALTELCDEDPALSFQWIERRQELHLRTTGRIQLEVLQSFLRERYNLAVTFTAPSVIYKETPREAAVGRDDYTWPKPCWACVDFLIEPLPEGSGLQYESICSPRDIAYRYQNHVETAVPRALQEGRLGWEVTDLKVTLRGGSHHEVHTHPLDFFVATPMAIARGLENAGVMLLEPMLNLRMRAPEDTLGRVVSLLVNHRASFDSPVVHVGDFTLDAEIPAEEFLEFPALFAAATGGRGSLGSRFSRYTLCPPGHGQPRERGGIDPLDRSKYILWARGALTDAQ
ncbi:MAG: TetM/TetW/TetO/TetS family tetracycline resistance ribosomal protection protein [Ruminococcaceae bacterium]|nr:TetM/TetW/TetO/TetS family tetracycline resistance ribosomal protection protein [Oscillospiraceae bacterium]